MRRPTEGAMRFFSKPSGRGRGFSFSWAVLDWVVVAAVLVAAVAVNAHALKKLFGFSQAGFSRADRARLAAQPGLDAYFDALTPCDLAARRAASSASARASYLAAVTDRHRAIDPALSAAVRSARQAWSALDASSKRRENAWRIALLDDLSAAVEGGWPHTHGDVICMPLSYVLPRLADPARTPELVRTLVHERVHVCQRAGLCRAASPEQARARVSVAAFDARFPELARRRRSNPARDGVLYPDADGDPAAVVVAHFDSEDAAARGGLAAARHTRVDLATGETRPAQARYEHPNEAQAYEQPFLSGARDGASPPADPEQKLDQNANGMPDP